MAQPPPPTLCEVTYDQDWDLVDLKPHVRPFRAVSSAKSCQSLQSGRYHNSYGPSPCHACPSMADNASVASCGVPSTYHEYLKTYYWDQSPRVLHNGLSPSSPTLPARSGTSFTWYGGYDGSEGGMGVGRGGDRNLLSLPSLSRAGQHPDDSWAGEDKRLPPHGKLKWVDALNAWVSEKQPTQRNPYINFINTPPRVERYVYTREGGAAKHGDWPTCTCQRYEDHMRLFRYKMPDRHLLLRAGRSCPQRHKDDQSRRLQRKSYSSPLYDPETLRKSRTVRFEAPRTASSSPQPIVLPEQIEVPQAVWEDDTTVLEGESFEMVQAQENLQEHVILVVVNEPTPPVDKVLEEAPTVFQEPLVWPEVEEEGVPTPVPEPEVIEDVPEEKPQEEPPPPEVVECQPAATSSPREPSKPPTPQPAPVNVQPHAVSVSGLPSAPVEEPVADISSSSESVTPPPTPPPVVARRPTVVDPEEAEAEKGNLVGLMSRLSSLQRARPKPKPKKERPVVENKPKPPRPKPVEKPPPPPPPKPVKPPKPPAPKPVKQPRPPRPKPEPKEKKIVPKPAPKPPPVKEKKPKPTEEEPVKKPIQLPISPPEEITPPEPREETPPPSPSPPPPPPPPPVVRAPVKKKEKLPPPPPRRRTPTPPPKPPSPAPEHKQQDAWIFGSDEEEKKEESKEKEEVPVVIDLPTLPPALPSTSPVSSPRPGAARGGRTQMNMPLMALKSRPRWGQKQKEAIGMDAEERERLAEEKRRKYMAMMNRHKPRKDKDKDGAHGNGPHFEDYGFLAKYCILNPSTTDKYRYCFDHMDEGEKGFLSEEETAYGLRAINPNLSASERTYLFRVLEMVGHKMKLGTDFKLFAILAALSQRVSRLDEWARNMMAQMDYKNLEMKLFLCKTLWECNVDDNTNTISLDQLIVELRAGGVSAQHEQEVRVKLADHRFLDFFDFLMYVPLFIMIHETVVTDPLSVSRTV